MTLTTAARAAHNELETEGEHIKTSIQEASRVAIQQLRDDGVIERPDLSDACAELEAAIYTYARACWQRDRAGA